MAKRKRNRNSEAALSSSVRKALTAHGCWCVRLQSGAVPITSAGGATRYMHSGEPGCPDLLVMYPVTRNANLYEIAFAEIKTPTGKLSKEQLAWHEKARARGVRVTTLRSIGEALGVLDAWQEFNRSMLEACK